MDKFISALRMHGFTLHTFALLGCVQVLLLTNTTSHSCTPTGLTMNNATRNCLQRPGSQRSDPSFSPISGLLGTPIIARCPLMYYIARRTSPQRRADFVRDTTYRRRTSLGAQYCIQKERRHCVKERISSDKNKTNVKLFFQNTI